MPDEAPLREFARLAICRGTLPRREPGRIWGGPGLGALCAVCEQPITADQVEYGVEFARDGSDEFRSHLRFRCHLRCFAVWELERTKP